MSDTSGSWTAAPSGRLLRADLFDVDAFRANGRGECQGGKVVIKGEVEVTVNKPVELVFRFISDPRSELVWNRNARKVEKLSTGPTNVGSRFRGSYRGAGTLDIEVTAYQPGQRTTSVGNSRLLGYELTDEFNAVGSGTRVRRSMVGTFKGPMRLLEPLMGGMFRKRFGQSGVLIKEAIESGTADTLPYEP